MAEQSKAKAKRLVKNPDTFRERALKAAEAGDNPKPKRVRNALGKVFGPIQRGLKKFFSLKPFRIIGKILRPLSRLFFITYLRNSWRELRLVTWPNWKQSRRLTLAVLIFAVVFGVTIAGVDYGLDKLFRNVLLK